MDDLHSLVAELLSGDDQRAEAAAARFSRLDSFAFAALSTMIEDADPDTRWWAVRALAELSHPGVPSLLIGALQDEDIAVRQCAALALSRQPAPEAVSPLTGLLASHDSLLSRLAANALIATGEPAVPALLEILQNGLQPAQLEGVRALALIGDPSTIPALFEALGGDSALMEYWASEGLDRMGVGMMFFQP